jgi:hypothetical protein
MDRNILDDSVEIDLINMTPAEAFVHRKMPLTGPNAQFEPRGICVNGKYGQEDAEGQGGGTEHTVDLDATHAFTNCSFKNEVVFYRKRHNCGIDHPDRLRAIKPFMTTARGIQILG